MASVGDLLAEGATLPGEDARREAEILLTHCLQCPRSALYSRPEDEVPAALASRFRALLQRRVQGEPVAYLVAQREFWSLPLTVTPATLIPRPETELLVEWALELALPADARVLDLGTGSGAIALALASERPGWQVTGVERDGDALAVAQGNAARLQLTRVRLLQSDWLAAVQGERFSLLVSNPPYIAPGDAHLARGDLRFEPASALVAGDAGLAALAAITEQAPGVLNAGGHLLLEHGYDQGAAVRQLLAGRGFNAVATRCDLAGNERASGGVWHAE